MQPILRAMVKQGTRSRLVLLLSPLAFLLLGLLLSPSPASAEEPTKWVAVLELTGAFERDTLLAFSNQVREGAVGSLKGTSYEVMTRENMAMLAHNKGIDFAACQEGAECQVDIGRKVGATLVLSGSVTKEGSTLVAMLKLHSIGAGRLLSSRMVKAADENSMLNKLSREASQLLRSSTTSRELSAYMIDRIIRNNESILRCVREEEALAPEMARQKIYLSFEILPDGGVTSRGVTNEGWKGTRLDRCISKELSKLKFPSFEGNKKKVTFPLQIN